MTIEPAVPNAVNAVVAVTFLKVSLSGGFSVLDFNGGRMLLTTEGLQLYSGTESPPTFLTSRFPFGIPS